MPARRRAEENIQDAFQTSTLLSPEANSFSSALVILVRGGWRIGAIPRLRSRGGARIPSRQGASDGGMAGRASLCRLCGVRVSVCLHVPLLPTLGLISLENKVDVEQDESDSVVRLDLPRAVVRLDFPRAVVRMLSREFVKRVGKPSVSYDLLEFASRLVSRR